MHIKNHDGKYLTEDQVKYVYKKVNKGKEINIETIKQEMEKDKMSKSEINDNCDNSYQKAILNEVNKEKGSIQMEDWSILSDHVLVNYLS